MVFQLPSMNLDSMYKYIGIVVILVASVYITGQCLNYQNYVIEGLANPRRKNMLTDDHFANLDQELTDINNNKKDTLLIHKYKSQFEDLLVGLNENTNLQLLEQMNEYTNCVAKKETKKGSKCLDHINKLHNMNGSLNNVMKYLDSQ
jgi:hypothetical protein